MITTLAITDDQVSFRQSLAVTLEKQANFSVAIQAGNGIELLEQLGNSIALPDVCLLDLQMPGMDGFETLNALQQHFPTVRTIVHSSFVSEHNVLRCFKYGACGLHDKTDGVIELIAAIRHVADGGRYIPSWLSTGVSNAILKHQINVPLLSHREAEFVRLCCSERSYKEIGQTMEINLKTVNRYRENVCAKLNVKGREGIIIYAFRTGMV